MTKDNEQVIVLLVIKKGDTFSNSYGLSKVLSRKFGILNYLDIVTVLNNNGFIEIKEDSGIKVFTITQKGEEFIKIKRLETLETLLKEFSKESEIIESLGKIE
jgi:predicted methyltransferase